MSESSTNSPEERMVACPENHDSHLWCQTCRGKGQVPAPEEAEPIHETCGFRADLPSLLCKTHPTPPATGDGESEHSLQYCGFFACHVGGGNCPFVANPKYRPTAPQEPAGGDLVGILVDLYVETHNGKAPKDVQDGDLDQNSIDRTVIRIEQLLATEYQRGRADGAKAYGGCTNCYGKGYATWRHGETHRNFTSKIRTDMKFCVCDRGKQLEKLVAALNDGGRE